MPKSTKIRMLRNTSTNTCHDQSMRNYCLWYIYIIPTVLRSNKIFKVCCVRVEKSSSPSDTKEGCRKYSGISKFNQI